MLDVVTQSPMGFEVIKKLRDKNNWSLRELANRTNSYPQQLSKLELGQTELTIGWIDRLSKAFDVPRYVFLDDDPILDLKPKMGNSKHHFQFGPETVPLLGQANGSGEAVVINFNEPVGEVPIHPNQKNIKGAFALYAVGESMSPRYRPGELIYAISRRQPLPNQDCLIELVKDGECFLKEFVKFTDKEIICRQLNPVKEWRHPKSDIKAVHAVVGRG